MPSLMPYGDKQRKCRQILHQFLQPSAIHQYNQLVMREVHKMLLGILNKPGNYAQHIRQSVTKTDNLFLEADRL